MTNTVAEISSTAQDIMDLLRCLDSPRDAAHALAIANVLLMLESDDTIQSEQDVREAVKEMDEAIVKTWCDYRSEEGQPTERRQ